MLAAWLLWAVALLALPAAMLVGWAFATTVIEVRELHPPEVADTLREDHRRLIDAGELTAAQAAEIYGTVTDRQPVEVLFVERRKLFVPPERPDIALLVVDRAANEDPWTPGRLRLAALGVAAAAAVLAVCLTGWLAVGRFASRRRRT